MIPPSPSRRRAEAFDAAVERGAVDDGSAGATELLGLVAGLRDLAAEGDRAARPAFVGDLRERLMAAAATELHPVAATPTRSRVAPPAPVRSRRERGLAAAVGALAIVGATTSMAVASQSALPGEVLYPVKRALESADTRLTAADQRGPELLDHASSRLSEIDALARRDQGRDLDGTQERTLSTALDTFADQASDASDELLQRFDSTGDVQSVTALKDFAGTSLDQLVDLEGTLPEAVRPALLDAAQVLFVIDQAADAACAECAGLGITEIPPTLVAATTSLTELVESAANVVVPQVGAGSGGVAPSAPQTSPSAAPTTPARPTPTQPVAPAPTPTPRPSQPAVPTTQADGVLPSTGVKKKANGTTGTLLGDIGTLLGGPTPATPNPSAPTLGEVLGGTVDGTLDTLDGVTGGLTGTLTDPLLRPQKP